MNDSLAIARRKDSFFFFTPQLLRHKTKAVAEGMKGLRWLQFAKANLFWLNCELTTGTRDVGQEEECHTAAFK